MKNKKTPPEFDEDDLYADLISVNEYTGFLQHLPVTNADIELYRRMYGGGPHSDDEIF